SRTYLTSMSTGHAVEIAHFKNPHSPDNLHLHQQLYVRYGVALFELLANGLTGRRLCGSA
ncbi:MAG TPA: hypothetical protein VE860_18555, partial [Chthoniobacterales bacterium]|nr:hypothetical protein [Chthoniobacterales bacterium]